MQHLCCKNSHYSIWEHKHLHSFHWIFLMALVLLVSHFLYFMINSAILLDTGFPIGLGSSYFWSILFSISFFLCRLPIKFFFLRGFLVVCSFSLGLFVTSSDLRSRDYFSLTSLQSSTSVLRK